MSLTAAQIISAIQANPNLMTDIKVALGKEKIRIASPWRFWPHAHGNDRMTREIVYGAHQGPLVILQKSLEWDGGEPHSPSITWYLKSPHGNAQGVVSAPDSLLGGFLGKPLPLNGSLLEQYVREAQEQADKVLRERGWLLSHG